MTKKITILVAIILVVNMAPAVGPAHACYGCTRTLGYWKNHPEAWLWNPGTPFFVSGKSWIEVLNTPPAGNAYYILAHQWIAADLNYRSGASLDPVIEARSQGYNLLYATHPDTIANLKGNDPLRQSLIYYAKILDDYNNGIIGPGPCVD